MLEKYVQYLDPTVREVGLDQKNPLNAEINWYSPDILGTFLAILFNFFVSFEIGYVYDILISQATSAYTETVEIMFHSGVTIETITYLLGEYVELLMLIHVCSLPLYLGYALYETFTGRLNSLSEYQADASDSL